MDRERCRVLPCDGRRLAERRWVGNAFRISASALQSVPPDATGPAGGVGLYHAAVELDDLDALAAPGDRPADHELTVSPVDRGIDTAL